MCRRGGERREAIREGGVVCTEEGRKGKGKGRRMREGVVCAEKGEKRRRGGGEGGGSVCRRGEKRGRVGKGGRWEV